MALSEALYPTLQCLEVALRNGIHSAATASFGMVNWYENTELIDSPKTLEIINAAKAKLEMVGKPIEADRVVAELQFGFWRQLFYAKYETKLWRPIILDVFPNAPKPHQSRKKLGSRIHRANELRNRTFHHEPIWRQPQLIADHEEMLETISWISLPMAELAKISTQFQSAYDMDLQALEPEMRRVLAMRSEASA